MHVADDAGVEGRNPPGAARMAAIAFLSFNLSLGCMFAPFGVLINPIEQRLGVTREISTLAVPLVTLCMSLLAPVVGIVANRMSLRLMMMAGSLSLAAGFAVLAVAYSTPVLLGAYIVLVGPGLAVCGVVAPSTLVTRWFVSGRGRALGIATTPGLMPVIPLLVTVALTRFGLAGAYWSLSTLALVGFVASFLARDRPVQQIVDHVSAPSGGTVSPAGPMPALLGDTRFWRLALAVGVYNGVIVMFSTQIVPYAISLHIAAANAVVLMTVYFVGTLVGTPLIGWFADRIGGTRMVGLLCVTFACWQAGMFVQPSYAVLLVLAGLAGLQGAAMSSCLGLALSEQFGQSGFARALGASTLIGLPFSVLSVPLASAIFVRTGSYSNTYFLAVIVLAIGAALALSVRGRSVAATVTLPA